MKHRGRSLDIPLFFAGFILSIIFVLFLLGMLLVHSHIAQSGTVEDTPLFSLEDDGRTVSICIVGEKITMGWEAYHRIEPALQKLSVFLPPGLRAFTACHRQLRLWKAGEPGRLERRPPPRLSLGASDGAAQKYSFHS